MRPLSSCAREATDVVILTIAIRDERDVVLARQRARHVAAMLGFDTQDQTRIATAVSEIARNAYAYAGGGRVELAIEGQTAPQLLSITVSDQGKGIANLDHVLSGRYQSPTGMGLGLVGSRRLMDGFEIRSSPGGTTVLLKKLLPSHSPLLFARDMSALADELARQRPTGPMEEVRQQNQELLAALNELQRRQKELLQLNGELEDTNRGVVALYAELDEKADHLRRADQLKSRFLSDMSHEFRTPLNSIIGLARVLAREIDGPLSEGQAKQVDLIEDSARELLTLVNDLLDLAKVEAGKIEIRTTMFSVADLFGALRGMLRPLLVSPTVRLTFDDVDPALVLFTDEAKVSQVLRNFISNALKFTLSGEVRVWVESMPAADPPSVRFFVSDTGIGIAPDNLERIFEEFSQIDSALQRRVRGTGLGLPLTRKFAKLLGGTVGVASAEGKGSTFWLDVPVAYPAQPAPPPEIPFAVQPDRPCVLIVEDAPSDQLIYENYLRDAPFHAVTVRTVNEARRALRELRPTAIILDVVLGQEHTWGLLTEIKRNPALTGVPILMITSVDDEAKAAMLGVDAFMSKPVDRNWLLDQLAARTTQENRT